jgi:hypothetical protein
MQGRCFPDQCVPDRKFLDFAPLVLFVPWINHPRPMYLFPGPHEGTGHNPVASYALLHPGHWTLLSLCLFDRLVPLQQVQARPTHSFYIALLRWGKILCRFAQSIFQDGLVRGTINKGLFVLGAQHPRIFGRGRTNIEPIITHRP